MRSCAQYHTWVVIVILVMGNRRDMEVHKWVMCDTNTQLIQHSSEYSKIEYMMDNFIQWLLLTDCSCWVTDGIWEDEYTIREWVTGWWTANYNNTIFIWIIDICIIGNTVNDMIIVMVGHAVLLLLWHQLTKKLSMNELQHQWIGIVLTSSCIILMNEWRNNNILIYIIIALALWYN